MEPRKIQKTMLRVPEVLERYGLAKSTLYLLMRQGRFVRPCKIGRRAVAFRVSDLERWESLQQPASEQPAGVRAAGWRRRVGANVVRYPRECDLCGKAVKQARLNVCDGSTMKSIVDLRASNGTAFQLQVRLMGRASAPEVACFPCLRRGALGALDVLGMYYWQAARAASLGGRDD
jgi:prophage regulatory protein